MFHLVSIFYRVRSFFLLLLRDEESGKKKKLSDSREFRRALVAFIIRHTLILRCRCAKSRPVLETKKQPRRVANEGHERCVNRTMVGLRTDSILLTC